MPTVGVVSAMLRRMLMLRLLQMALRLMASLVMAMVRVL